jgi:hypothetical protein
MNLISVTRQNFSINKTPEWTLSVLEERKMRRFYLDALRGHEVSLKVEKSTAAKADISEASF